MENKLENILRTERTVEVQFMNEIVQKYMPEGSVIIDIGGKPSRDHEMREFYNTVDNKKYDYRVCDFRGGQYMGDFLQIDFEDTRFDAAIFLSSIEHFPQCTESDLIFRPGYDRKGYQKALELLKPGGYIFLTVPMGKHVWQNYHQNYNYQGILDLTADSTIIEEFVYVLDIPNETWNLQTKPYNIDHILYTNYDRGAECVGCFVLQKI
jgi:SAM-dependent methyltransferase